MDLNRARHLFLVAVLILAGVGVLSFRPYIAETPICRSASGLNRFGVNEVLGWPDLYPPARLERALSIMADAGIGWVRVNWAWKDLQPDDGPFDFAHLDDVARIAAEHHIQLLPILTAVPAWSSTAPEQLKAERGSLSPVDRYRPAKIADWLNYVRTAIQHYDSLYDSLRVPRIKYWEVWNEPNIPDFWPPSPDAAEYLAMLRATYQAIKAVNPEAQVVLGGLANGGLNSDGSSYLKNLYDLGGGSFFDVVSIHVYSHPRYGVGPVEKSVNAVRAEMDAHGDKNKPLWLTEIGWSDAPDAWGAPTVDQNEVASFLKAVYASPMPADVIFWYNFRNIFANSPDAEHNFGLVNADFSAKPAFTAFKALAVPCARQDTVTF